MYQCDGVSSRQHNEPCGSQDVWHYYLHVFPRYKNDELYKTDRKNSKPEERVEYSKRIKDYFDRKQLKTDIFTSKETIKDGSLSYE